MDRPAALALRDLALAGDGAALSIHLLLLALLGAMAWRRHGRPRLGGALGAILAGAAVVRAGVLPVARHVYDGHEADYFDAFRGLEQASTMGYRFYPTFALLYRGLGQVLPPSGEALLAVSLAVGVGSVALAAAWTARVSGSPAVGVATAGLLAVDPAWAFWSSSAYNVMIPMALCLGAGIALDRAARRADALALCASSLLFSLAVAFRVDAGLLAAPLLVQAGAQREGLTRIPWRRSAAAILPGVALLAWHAVAAGLLVPRPEGSDSPLRYASEMFALQWRYPGPMAPWGAPWMLALAVAGLALLVAEGGPRRRGGLVFLAAALPLHLLYAGFDDYGERHTLPIRLALAALTAGAGRWVALRAAQAGRGGLGRILAAGVVAAALAGLVPSLGEAARRYYAPPAVFLAEEADFKGAPYTRPELYARSCVFISDSFFYRDMSTASHFEVLDPDLFAGLWARYDGCLVLVWDLESFQRTSRGVSERAEKVRALFPLTLLGKRLRPDLEDYSLLYRISPRDPAPAPSTSD